VLAGFKVAYNARRQRGLKGRSPEMVLRERLTAKPELANPLAKPPDPETLPSALRVVADAKEVSHPDRRLRRSPPHRPCRRHRAWECTTLSTIGVFQHNRHDSAKFEDVKRSETRANLGRKHAVGSNRSSIRITEYRPADVTFKGMYR
jgi:hypothetical protein